MDDNTMAQQNTDNSISTTQHNANEDSNNTMAQSALAPPNALVTATAAPSPARTLSRLETLPPEIRLRIYHSLGFPVDKHYGWSSRLGHLYPQESNWPLGEHSGPLRKPIFAVTYRVPALFDAREPSPETLPLSRGDGIRGSNLIYDPRGIRWAPLVAGRRSHWRMGVVNMCHGQLMLVSSLFAKDLYPVLCEGVEYDAFTGHVFDQRFGVKTFFTRYIKKVSLGGMASFPVGKVARSDDPSTVEWEGVSCLVKVAKSCPVLEEINFLLTWSRMFKRGVSRPTKQQEEAEDTDAVEWVIGQLPKVFAVNAKLDRIDMVLWHASWVRSSSRDLVVGGKDRVVEVESRQYKGVEPYKEWEGDGLDAQDEDWMV